MRLPAQYARAIERHHKTTHRIPVDPRLTARPLRPARRHGGRPFRAEPDDILTIYGGHHTLEDGKPKWETTQIVHAKILKADRAPLGHLTTEQAQAEGHPTPQEFEIHWIEHHERPWLDRQSTYLLNEGIPEDEVAEARDAWAIVRYAHHWAPREAWTLTLEPFHDMPFLLPGLPEEPEAIPAERLHKRWEYRSAKHYSQARDEEQRVREAKQLGRRLRSAKLRNPNAPEITVIEAQLAALEARHTQAA